MLNALSKPTAVITVWYKDDAVVSLSAVTEVS